MEKRRYKVGDKVIITETKRTSLYEGALGKIVEVVGLSEHSPGLGEKLEPSIIFIAGLAGDYYCLESCCRPATDLDLALE